MKAFLKNYRQSPRKVRKVADLIKGKDVEEAISLLDFLAKRAGFPIKKLLLSAVANAKETGADKADLFVKDLRVDKGIVMKRIMPAAMGSAHRINKRTSHITLLLAAKESKEKKKTKSEKGTKSKKTKNKTESKKEIKKVPTKVGIPTKAGTKK